ncbi:MAG: hypothetical protein WD178_04745 [Actinomycetota bacterium]
MCTFHSDKEVQVCDVAIPHVKAQLAADADAIRFTHLEGEGTLVQAVGDIDPAVFERRVRSGMAAAEASEVAP